MEQGMGCAAALRSEGTRTVIGTTLNQRFILEKELGRGGMGAVYQATDQVLNRPVAIKVLKERTGEEVGQRIRLEAQILARLVHDNIVRLYDFGESDGIYYFVMEIVIGSSYQRRWKHLPLGERLLVAAQVADALAYAHQQGVIHRDVKPANVLLTATDQAKLSDFGLSKIVEDGDESGTVKGTPHYMSPEQARGKRLDPRSDLYSLGIMLYESVVGETPFQGPPLAIMAQHVRGVPESPRTRNPAITPTLDALILRLLAKEPGDRPASGQVVSEALRVEATRIAAVAPPDQLPGPSPGSISEIGPLDVDGPSQASAATPTMAAAAPMLASKSSLSSTTLSPEAVRATPELVREMLETVLAEPITLSPDERYLCGHYLAYLLGGARRRGPLLRRKFDPKNADRARLLLGLTAVLVGNPSESDTSAAIARAVELLEMRHDVRPLLNPMVVMKYLACRDTPARRKRLRQVRKQIQQQSPYAQRQMTDRNGVLNPGVIPQSLEDLRLIAPDRTELDDQLVARWNRVSDEWRSDPKFREAVLRYATRSAASHPASADLWPEVVYPLIQRARTQRQHRPRAEVIKDALFESVLHAPNPGLRFDHAYRLSVPEPVSAKLDASLDALVDSDELEIEPTASAPPKEKEYDHDPESVLSIQGGISLHDLAIDLTHDRAPPKRLIRLAGPDPVRFLQGELRGLWQEAVETLNTTGQKKGHRPVSIGPYRVAVIPSVRSRSAGQLAIQGMPNKQIEILTPPFRSRHPDSKPIMAAWAYQDNSLALVHLDFRGIERYILWHAPSGRQSNYDSAAELNHDLYQLGLEAPDQLDRVLSTAYRPHSAV
jgi:serine/threonine-protein kinase